MKLLLRRVSPEKDAAAIAEIYNAYVLGSTATFDIVPVTEAAMRSRVAEISARFPYWVCEAETADGNGARGEIAGYCCAHPWRTQTAYAGTLETTVYVSPNRRGNGVGRRLMEQLIAECRSRGFHALVACITADNEASIRLHRQLGFRQVSRFFEVGEKFGRLHDVTDYELTLG